MAIVLQVFHYKYFRERKSDQVPGIYLAGPEKLHSVRKPGIMFQSPKFSKNSLNFLIIYAYIYHFESIIGRRGRAKITAEILYFGVKCKFLREVLFIARTNIFGKVVTLERERE